MRLSPGDRLGPYEIRSALGAGGMGEVYRAHDERLKRDVALKILRTELFGNPSAVKRFEQEARAAAAVSHPNIVAIYEFETAGDTPFIVSEFLHGTTLREWHRGAMPWRKAVEVVLHVAEGLAAAHNTGVIHRDLKPENIFVTSDGVVKILDFGIAHLMEVAPTEPGDSDPTPTAPSRRAIGTVGYAAPEQLTLGCAEPPADIFSLGIILYELISGVHPFKANSNAETIAAVLHEEPRPLRQTDTRLPVALDHLITHCLNKRPQERFQSTDDLVYELREIIRNADGLPERRMPARRLAAIGAAVLALIATAIVYEYKVRLPAGLPITSIAILPMANTTRDPNLDYVSDGITDTLINQLSALPNVRITARPTVFQYKAKTIDPVAVGKELGVAAVATGRVDVHGDNIVIAADLIDAKSGTELWGNTYRRVRQDMYMLPGDIAHQIASELRIRLTEPQKARILRPPTNNPAAFDLYLRGVHALNLNTKEGRAQAIAFFQHAVEADPDFSRAWAALAESYTLYSRYADPHVMRTKAREDLEHALRLDPDLAEAHVSAGLLHLWDEWNFRAAEQEFRKAIELNPNLTSAHIEYSNTLRYLGRFDEAMREARTAEQLDPLSRASKANVAHVLIFAGQPRAAIAELEPLIHGATDFADAHYYLASAYEQEGRFREACEQYVRDDELAGRDAQVVTNGREACNASGLAGYFRQKLNYYLTDAPLKEPFVIATFYLRVGDKEQAYAFLDRAYEAQSANMLLLKTDPVFKPIRNEPRFRELMNRIGFDSTASREPVGPQQKERGKPAVVQPQSQISDARPP